MSAPSDAAQANLLRAVGRRVREARDAKGLSQGQLAQRIGMTRASVANLEAGRQDMNISRLAVIAQVLGLDLGALIRPEDLPPLPPEPHVVITTCVYEVSCRTCDGLVLNLAGTRDLARETRDGHIAKMLAEGGTP